MIRGLWKYGVSALLGGLLIIGGLAVAVVIKDRVLADRPEALEEVGAAEEEKEPPIESSLDTCDIYIPFDFRGKVIDMGYYEKSETEKDLWASNISKRIVDLFVDSEFSSDYRSTEFSVYMPYSHCIGRVEGWIKGFMDSKIYAYSTTQNSWYFRTKFHAFGGMKTLILTCGKKNDTFTATCYKRGAQETVEMVLSLEH